MVTTNQAFVLMEGFRSRRKGGASPRKMKGVAARRVAANKVVPSKAYREETPKSSAAARTFNNVRRKSAKPSGTFHVNKKGLGVLAAGLGIGGVGSYLNRRKAAALAKAKKEAFHRNLKIGGGVALGATGAYALHSHLKNRRQEEEMRRRRRR